MSWRETAAWGTVAVGAEHEGIIWAGTAGLLNGGCGSSSTLAGVNDGIGALMDCQCSARGGS